jgi:hypothetical protein
MLGPKQVLAVVPQVPDAGPEDDDQAQRDEEQGRHQHGAVLPAAGLDAALPHVDVEADRVLAQGQQQQAAGDQGENHRRQRPHDGAPPARRPRGLRRARASLRPGANRGFRF